MRFQTANSHTVRPSVVNWKALFQNGTPPNGPFTFLEDANGDTAPAIRKPSANLSWPLWLIVSLSRHNGVRQIVWGRDPISTIWRPVAQQYAGWTLPPPGHRALAPRRACRNRGKLRCFQHSEPEWRRDRDTERGQKSRIGDRRQRNFHVFELRQI